MNQIKQIHAHTLRNNIDQSHFLITRLLQLPNLLYAHSILLHSSLSSSPSSISPLFNTLLHSYSSHGPFHHCISLFNSLLLLHPSPPSFTSLLSACASFNQPFHGRALHALLLKFGFIFDPFVSTSLLTMYSKCGLVDSATKVFDEMPYRDVASWNSLLDGYAKSGDLMRAQELFDSIPVRNVISWTSMVAGFCQNGRYEDALQVFVKMWEDCEVRPNEVTLASVLPACANLGSLELGKRIERNAWRMFEEIGDRRNLCSWNSMIMGLAVHGSWKDALELFHDMKARRITPDDITFIGVLMACTHGGLVEHGRTYFRSMEREFQISPKLEHYGCMVDLLGRAGCLREAYDLSKSMPMKPDSVIWGALLGACSFHGEVGLAEIAAEFLSELEPWNAGNHVILSNIYASSGQWDGVAKEWKLMKWKKYRKIAGHSFIEVGGKMDKFLVEDKSHPRAEEIYAMLNEVTLAMKLLQYFPDLDYHLECYD
ncbi:TPR-like protein [Dioscorea alata]|uniref:TPR-like protein n=1 Tax=Dioscorea alata TaxID=55571 RepID=A0ACB7WU84_DIOAL|nr:TPR-like protein [Dioscorea alata]